MPRVPGGQVPRQPAPVQTPATRGTVGARRPALPTLSDRGGSPGGLCLRAGPSPRRRPDHGLSVAAQRTHLASRRRPRLPSRPTPVGALGGVGGVIQPVSARPAELQERPPVGGPGLERVALGPALVPPPLQARPVEQTDSLPLELIAGAATDR